MLTWLHSALDIIAHRKGKTNGFIRTFGHFGLLSVHTPTLSNQMRLEARPEHRVYIPRGALTTSSVKLQTQK